MNAGALISAPFLALLVGVVAQFHFLFNADVIGGTWLTWGAVSIGLLLALGFGYARHRAHRASLDFVEPTYRVRWFSRLVNWPLIVLFCVMASTVALSRANRGDEPRALAEVPYTVRELGTRRVGGTRYNYVRVSDGAHELLLNCVQVRCPE